MGNYGARAQSLRQIERLAGSAADSRTLRQEAIVELRRAIGFDLYCAMLIDPDALSGYAGMGEYPPDFYSDVPRLITIDADLREVNNAVTVARDRDAVGVLSAATDGDLARSKRWREIYRPIGLGDELRSFASDERGCWGGFLLFRASDDTPFDSDDARLLRDASTLLAGSLRRDAVRPTDSGPRTSPLSAGVVLFADDLRPYSQTGSATAWFQAMNPTLPAGVPAEVWCVVGRLLGAELGQEPDRLPRARIRTADGTFAILEAARLDSGGIAVTIHPAGVDDILSLLVRVHGLSPRERELLALLVKGLDTRELAERMVISRHTVQDHLKSVFEKTGVRSRRELVSTIFPRAA